MRVICAHLYFFKHTATTEIYTRSLHDHLPICRHVDEDPDGDGADQERQELRLAQSEQERLVQPVELHHEPPGRVQDRKSTRLNSSHANISYAAFCLKKIRTSHPQGHCPPMHYA